MISGIYEEFARIRPNPGGFAANDCLRDKLPKLELSLSEVLLKSYQSGQVEKNTKCASPTFTRKTVLILIYNDW